jgi:DNA-binding Xre family transcriptional regulator
MNEVISPAARSRAISDFSPAALLHWRKKVRMLTQAELAHYAGISRGEVSHLETSKRKPQATTLRALCIALQCEPGDLLEPGS